MREQPAETPHSPVRIRFGDVELDEELFELRRRGERVPVQAKPLRLLLHLARNRHRVARRDELFELLWPDVVVTEGALSRCVKKARLSLEAAGASPELIQTIRGVGFRFVAKTDTVPSTATDRPAPAVSDERHGAVPLVGRASELARLETALETTLAGSGRGVLVTGEAGIGKSRLIDEFARAARGRGSWVWMARAWSGPGVPPFWLWAQVMRAASEALGPELLPQVLGREEPEIAHFAPFLLDSEAHAANSRPVTLTEDARFRMMDAAARCLARAASLRHLVVILEDLQSADASSLLMLDFLARHIPDHPILLLATQRARPASTKDAVASFSRNRAVEWIHLEGLTGPEVERLCAELGTPVGSRLGESIRARTGGNPFFVMQLARAAKEHEEGGRNDGDGREKEFLEAIPLSVEALVLGRIEHLSQSAQTLLKAASVAGPEFETTLIARAAGLTPQAGLQALDEALAAGLLFQLRSRPGTVALTHSLVREALLRDLGELGRRTLHLQIGKAIEARHAGDTAFVPALAHHFGAAAELVEDQAVEYSIRAGDLAHAALDFDEAARLYEQALAALDLRPDPARRRAEILNSLGLSLQLAGSREASVEAFRGAMRWARSSNLPKVGAMAAVGLAAFEAAELRGEVQATLRAADAALGEEPSLERVWTMSSLAARLLPGRRNAAEAERMATRAVEMARALGDPRALGFALCSQAEVRRRALQDRAVDRLAAVEEAATIAASTRDPGLGIRAGEQLIGLRLELANVSAAELQVGELAEISARVPFYDYIAASFRICRMLLEARFDAAEELASRVFTHRGSAEGPNAAIRLAVVAFARSEQGRLGELADASEDLSAQIPDIPVVGAGAVLALVEAGRHEQARALLDEMSRDDFDDILGTESWRVGAALLARACIRLEDRERAGVLYRLLEPFGRHVLLVGEGAVCFGPTALVLADLATLLGDFELAECHLGAAGEVGESLRSKPWRARIAAAEARMRSNRGAPGDRPIAEMRMREAAAVARECGLVALAQEIGMLSGPVSPSTRGR